MNDDRQMCVLFCEEGKYEYSCEMQYAYAYAYLCLLFNDMLYIYIFNSVVGVVADGDNDAFYAWRAQVLNSQKKHTK